MGARDRIRDFFIANVGKVVTTQRIRSVGGISEYARRIRELRDEEGYQIKSHVDRADLKPGQYILETLERKPVIARAISPQRELLEAYPQLTTEDIRAALAYAAEMTRERIIPIPVKAEGA